MKWSVLSLSLWLSSFYCSQALPEHLELLTYLPKELKENSGLALLPDSDLIWVINDSNNKDHLYGISVQGKIEKEYNIKGAVNKDWEDLAADGKGKIFIADIGNNNFNRDELYIYILTDAAVNTDDDLRAEEIEFRYPGNKKNQPFNAEALVYFENYLYIFTKNQNDQSGSATRVYRVPAKAGKYTASYVTTIDTCEDSGSCRITAADISPDGKTLALLSYQKLWLGPNFLADGSTPNLESIDLQHRTQKEGLCFSDNETLLLSDERSGGSGGILYRYRLKP